MSERFLKYFDEMPHYVAVHDRQLRVLDANRRFREDFGEARNEPCHRLLRGAATPCAGCVVESAFATGLPQRSQGWVRRHDGTEIPVDSHAIPIRDDRGTVIAVLVQSSDNRDLRNVQRRLVRNQERWARLFEEVPCSISVNGPDFLVQHGNRRFRTLFGDTAGQPCYRVYRQRSSVCPMCPLLPDGPSGEVHDHEELLTNADGETINALTSVVPVYDPDGIALLVMELVTDVTQIRTLQSQLASIGLLVGSISHGVKGALSGLDGGSYMVSSGLERDLPERVREGWDMMQRAVGRIRGMVMDILYLAKDRQLELEPVDATALGEEVLQVAAGKTAASDVTVELAIPPAIGPFRADRRRVGEALLNLVDNAISACLTDADAGPHRVVLSASSQPPWIVFHVEDDGIGMDEEARSRAFTLFYSTKGSQGTGLGLYIAHQIATKHGGDLRVESEPGRGTCFTLRLPLSGPSSDPDDGGVPE